MYKVIVEAEQRPSTMRTRRCRPRCLEELIQAILHARRTMLK